ncbi:uncharacterized protein LOC111082271 [Drosophila obscura]|uniref:uncharacterized protein LOC111082271 n=1 Tax=Drosophila obscura TaxID=7282 RepID=UPI001BB1B3E1|nr:uncharacterized protein LOC111082271 [Drosophila obscura]
MEGRRFDRQRRDSAKSTAAPTLPSTQDQNFHLRLADLYGQHACLWNTSLAEYQNVELKRQAWDTIAGELGSHLNVAFVRSRISSMRHQLNVYKLQMIEYKMCPGLGQEPEKPYHLDAFAFLDTIHALPELDARPRPDQEAKQELGAGQAPKRDWRLQSPATQPEQGDRPGDSQFTYHNAMSIVKMVKQRMAAHQQLPKPSMSHPQLMSSMASLNGSQQMYLDAQAATPPNLRARPGDSISSTKLSTRAREIRMNEREREREREQERARTDERPTTSKPRQTELGEIQSEEMELYRLHWSVRQQMRSRRPSRANASPEPAPPLPKRQDSPDSDFSMKPNI